jgi:sensor domain CHASE-containing protein
MVHMESSRRSRESEAKGDRFDGVKYGVVDVGPNYPSVAIIFLLAHMGILVFCFCYK